MQREVFQTDYKQSKCRETKNLESSKKWILHNGASVRLTVDISSDHGGKGVMREHFQSANWKRSRLLRIQYPTIPSFTKWEINEGCLCWSTPHIWNATQLSSVWKRRLLNNHFKSWEETTQNRSDAEIWLEEMALPSSYILWVSKISSPSGNPMTLH